MHPKKLHLGKLLEVLERHRQRATYGAVGGVVGLGRQGVMRGQDKNPRNSFVVSQKTHRPTGYTREQCHELLELNRHVISSAGELDAWLKAHP